MYVFRHDRKLLALRRLGVEVRQKARADCGPACVLSIFRFFAIPATYDEVYASCRTGVEGTRLIDLEDTLENQGVRARSMTLEAQPVLVGMNRFCLRMPLILIIDKAMDIHHYAVLYEADNNGFWFMDPAVGRLRFNSKNTGIPGWTGNFVLCERKTR